MGSRHVYPAEVHIYFGTNITQAEALAFSMLVGLVRTREKNRGKQCAERSPDKVSFYSSKEAVEMFCDALERGSFDHLVPAGGFPLKKYLAYKKGIEKIFWVTLEDSFQGLLSKIQNIQVHTLP
jgi:hypothetical protein